MHRPAAGRARGCEPASEAPVSEVVGAILLVLGIVLAAALAIWVTRWALHMNE